MMHFRPWWIFLGLVYIAMIVTLSLLRMPDINQTISFTDKIVHFIMYFILVGWFVQLYHHRDSRLLILLAAIALGLVMELLQGMTDYRSFDYADCLVNGVGACCAFLLSTTRFASLLQRVDLWLYNLSR